jgi:plasmid stability protein
MERETVALMVRIDAELHRKLKVQAAAHRVSMAAEVEDALRRHFRATVAWRIAERPPRRKP